MSLPRRFPPPAVPFGLLLLATSAAATAAEPLDTFSLRVGGYVSTFDTTLRADGQTITGTEFDLKRDLNLDQNDAIAFVGLTWRPFDHHEFALAYYQDDMSADKRLQRDIVFDDTVYPASATVRSKYELSAYEASYVWWAASRERWALGPRVGLIWYKVSLGIKLEIDVDGHQTGGSLGDEISADLPAPTIGGSWRWSPAEQWRFSADAGYFTIDTDGIDADVVFARAGVEWYPWERVGFWLDYTVNNIDAQVEKSELTGNFDFRDSGARLGIVYRF